MPKPTSGPEFYRGRPMGYEKMWSFVRRLACRAISARAEPVVLFRRLGWAVRELWTFHRVIGE